MHCYFTELLHLLGQKGRREEETEIEIGRQRDRENEIFEAWRPIPQFPKNYCFLILSRAHWVAFAASSWLDLGSEQSGTKRREEGAHALPSSGSQKLPFSLPATMRGCSLSYCCLLTKQLEARVAARTMLRDRGGKTNKLRAVLVICQVVTSFPTLLAAACFSECADPSFCIPFKAFTWPSGRDSLY